MTAATMRPRTTSGSDFAELNRRVNALGLLRRQPGYYALRLTAVGLMVTGGWVAFFLVGRSWWTLLVAAFLAAAFAQLALVAHDLAHRQVFRTKAQRDRRQTGRQPRHRHELRLVDGQAHPPPQQPEP